MINEIRLVEPGFQKWVSLDLEHTVTAETDITSLIGGLDDGHRSGGYFLFRRSIVLEKQSVVTTVSQISSRVSSEEGLMEAGSLLREPPLTLWCAMEV